MAGKRKTISAPKKQKRRVLLLFDTDREYRRGLLRGFSDYFNAQGLWNVHLSRPLRISKVFELIQHWNPDGLIYETPPLKDLDKLLSLDIPVIVQVLADKKHENLGHIIPDDFQIGAMAAEYYLDKGFKSYAFCGYKKTSPGYDLSWSGRRYEGFCRTVEAKEFTVEVYEQNYVKALRLDETELLRIADWLKELTWPVAVFACDDIRACDVIEACRLGQVAVPDEVAVLGVDNEEVTCSFFNPPLSSIAYNAELAGYEAAGLLDKMMAGHEIESDHVLIHPKFVVERQSTNVMQIEDKDVVKAIGFIRQNSDKILQVPDVLRSVSVSKRSLDYKFNKIFGHTVYEEIRKHHAKYIAELLIETNMSIQRIAWSLGYTSEYNISRFFRETMGCTPREYRKKYGRK